MPRRAKTGLLWSVDHCAEQLGISSESVRELISGGAIPVRYYKGQPLIYSATVLRYLEQLFSSSPVREKQKGDTVFTFQPWGSPKPVTGDTVRLLDCVKDEINKLRASQTH